MFDLRFLRLPQAAQCPRTPSPNASVSASHSTRSDRLDLDSVLALLAKDT